MPEEQEPFVAEDGKVISLARPDYQNLCLSAGGGKASITLYGDGRITAHSEVPPDEAAKALIDAFLELGWLSRAAQRQWRPIATAPKDKSVLLYTPYGLMYCGRWRYGTLGEPQQDVLAWRCDSSGRFADPTKWQPLPAPPEAT